MAIRFPARLLLVALLCTAFHISTAQAGKLEASNLAFDALLSLPQTQPDEGEWRDTAPDGFDAANADETTLIHWLQQQKQAGADFNHIRHQGTLLHHALRGRLERTALWLLVNGADPLQLQGERDALALAVSYRCWRVVDALLKLPAVINPARSQAHLNVWLEAAYRPPVSEGAQTPSAANDDEIATLNRLIALKVPLPTGIAGEQLMFASLERHWWQVALRLSTQGVQLRSPKQVANHSRGARFDLSNPSDIEALDARIDMPLFALIASKAKTAKEVDAAWQLQVRRPFEDEIFTRTLILLTLQRTNSSTRNNLARIPAAAREHALLDEQVLSKWVQWAMRQAPADAEWGLNALGDIPKQRPVALLEGLLKNAYWYNSMDITEQVTNQHLVNGWQALLARLPSPLPMEMDGKLWMFVPASSRVTLLKMGYKPSSRELHDWMDRSSIADIRALWPQLKASLPDLLATAHQHLLKPYALGQTAYHCHVFVTPEKVALLLELGAKPRQPVTLDAQCRHVMGAKLAEVLLAAGMITPPTPPETTRFRLSSPDCQITDKPLWLANLVSRGKITDIPIDAAQWIPLPDRTNCGLLVSGGNGGGRRLIDEDGFTGTQRFTPCADGDFAMALRQIVDGQVHEQIMPDMPANSGFTMVEDSLSKQFVFVGSILSGGTCGSSYDPPVIMNFVRKENAPPGLALLPQPEPLTQALVHVCNTHAELCFGSDKGETSENYGLPAFIGKHWATEQEAYIAAVLALDHAKLGQGQKIPAYWHILAIEAVTKSPLSLKEKRQRTAWLFRSPQLREALEGTGDQQVLEGLLGWLPIEDWTPIIKALSSSASRLEQLATKADAMGKPQLACRFMQQLGRSCNTSVGA